MAESLFGLGLEGGDASVKEFKCSVECSKRTVAKTSMCVSQTETSVTAILAMFMERGSFSGHCYQPFLNHRELDVALLLHEHQNDKGVMQRPMIESHLVDEPEESFGLITPITFCPYEVRNDSGGLVLRSHGSLIGHVSSEHDVQCASVLSGRTAYHVSGRAFARTLSLLGYRWVASDGAVRDESVPPTIDELMEFIHLFKGHGLQNKDSFITFLRAFRLERVYEYNEAVDLWYNIRYLSEILRALTPFRLAVVDGQHRAVLMVLFTCGYFKPTNELILDGCMPLSKALGDRPGDFSWDRAQVWRQTKIAIGYAVDEGGGILDDLRAGQAVLRKYGKVLTDAQAQSVTFNWVQLYRDLIPLLQQAQNQLHFDPASDARRLGFGYWSQSAERQTLKRGSVGNNWYIYEQRLTSVFDAFVRYIKGNKSVASLLFRSKQQKDVASSWENASRSTFTGSGKMFGLNDRKSTDELKMVLNLLKLFALEPDLYQKIRLITEVPDVQVAQNRDDVLDFTSGFRSPWWIQTFVMGTTKANHEVFLAKLLCERKILEDLRKQPITPMLTELLAEQDPDFGFLEVTLPRAIANVKAYKMRINNTRGVALMSKILYAFHQTIVLDILETIGRYGYDPDLTQLGMPADGCKNYTWYLK